MLKRFVRILICIGMVSQWFQRPTLAASSFVSAPDPAFFTAQAVNAPLSQFTRRALVQRFSASVDRAEAMQLATHQQTSEEIISPFALEFWRDLSRCAPKDIPKLLKRWGHAEKISFAEEFSDTDQFLYDMDPTLRSAIWTSQRQRLMPIFDLLKLNPLIALLVGRILMFVGENVFQWGRKEGGRGFLVVVSESDGTRFYVIDSGPGMNLKAVLEHYERGRGSRHGIGWATIRGNADIIQKRRPDLLPLIKDQLPFMPKDWGVASSGQVYNNNSGLYHEFETPKGTLFTLFWPKNPVTSTERTSLTSGLSKHQRMPARTIYSLAIPYIAAAYIVVVIGLADVTFVVCHRIAMPSIAGWPSIKGILLAIAYSFGALIGECLDRRRGIRWMGGLLSAFIAAPGMYILGIWGITVGLQFVPDLLFPSIVIAWTTIQSLVFWTYKLLVFKKLSPKLKKYGFYFFTSWRWLSIGITGSTIVVAILRLHRTSFSAVFLTDLGIFPWIFIALALLECIGQNLYDPSTVSEENKFSERSWGPSGGIIGRQLQAMRTQLAREA